MDRRGFFGVLAAAFMARKSPKRLGVVYGEYAKPFNGPAFTDGRYMPFGAGTLFTLHGNERVLAASIAAAISRKGTVNG